MRKRRLLALILALALAFSLAACSNSGKTDGDGGDNALPPVADQPGDDQPVDEGTGNQPDENQPADDQPADNTPEAPLPGDIAAMPVYPTSDANTITLVNNDAVEVTVQSSGLIENNFGPTRCFIVPGNTVTFALTLAEGSDAELSSVESNTGDGALLSECVDGEAYTFTTSTYSGRSYTTVEYMDPITGDDIVILVFASREQLNLFLAGNLLGEDGTLPGSWRYTDSVNAPDTTALPDGSDALPEGSSLYYLSFTDQNGDPVPGITANVCDDDSCVPMESDELGIVAFAKPGKAYHIQVIKVPDGYEYDTSAETYTAEDGGVLEFTVTKK